MILYSTQIHALGSPKYRLRCPLLVKMEEYDADEGTEHEVIASIPEFDLWAGGVSDSLALMNLKTEIVLTYEHLTELGSEKLGSLLLQCFWAMQAVIIVSDAAVMRHREERDSAELKLEILKPIGTRILADAEVGRLVRGMRPVSTLAHNADDVGGLDWVALWSSDDGSITTSTRTDDPAEALRSIQASE